MAEWIDLEIGKNLTVELMNNLHDDFQYIHDKLQEQGISVPELANTQVSYDISQADILGKFNAVEENIDKLHELANYPDIYYGSSFRWTICTDMLEYLKTGIMRWFNWILDAKKHCDGEFETAYLSDQYGNQIVDENTNKILVYKEW